MRIAIVEDDRIDMSQLRRTLETFCSNSGIPCELEGFAAGEDFLAAFSAGKYEMIFFDNYIGETLGINLARHVRKTDTEAALVFVTTSPDFAVESFDIGALHYIMKPVTLEGIAKVFDRWKVGREMPAPMVELLVNRVPIHIPADSIQYIETADKNCIIHCQKQELKVHITMDKLAEQLPGDKFLRTHRSFIVSMDFIKRMSDHAFLLKNDGTVPVSRLAWAEAKSKYMEYLLNK
jgi:DNA-binding LytR/AlgR family response regulator